MSIEKLNTILEKLKSQHNKENVLEFSFALIEWMGLELNSGKIPQLIAPKTLKLKEYLENTEKTNQPQLYRLTSDSQPVRIRFAVLKKIRKEYISQLVDNDPGNESFQNTPEPIRAVTKAPYFIHFITTPDYDRLIVVFNKSEQKRIISFRNRLTNTQYFKIVKQWEGISSKSKIELEDIFWKSLDIKEVNKEFYKKIKARFDDLISIVENSKIETSNEQIKQFSIRLIGRYIFCWFLKEKGIIPEELINSDKINNTQNYFKNYLNKLFFNTLNTKVQDRNLAELGDSAFEKIPYLNGGLFDENDEDIIFKELNLNDWLISFVTILEGYDFTVDESSSTYQQVAVDPEMLGRIFENLLASQNPETEKIANDERKEFGAFYTPREIVDFMAEESIKTYLANSLKIKNEELNSAFQDNAQWPEKLNSRKKEAEEYLRNLKILDPACGSGAFPMGILHRLITLRELTGFYPNTYELKKEILSNNIYGIDIMPMAVDIARLRAWLSLIVEEDYNPDKSRSNFGIDSLPNLEFKFTQGNSLLETYEGIKLFDDKLLESNSGLKQYESVKRIKEKIDKIQKEYFKLNREKKLTVFKKTSLLNELKLNQEIIKQLQKNVIENNNGNIFVKDSNSFNIADKLKKLHVELFKTSDKENKKIIKNEIENLEWNLIVSTLEDNEEKNKIKELEKLRKQNIKPYFIYKLNFPEVFTEKNGFDIVIGNPPYVRQESIDPYYKSLYIENHPEVGSGITDLYVYFFDSAIDVLNENGIILFITLNKYLKTKYGEGLRNKLKSKNVDFIIDFFELPVFEASNDTAITKIINNYSEETRYYPVKSLDNLDLNSLIKGKYLFVLKDGSEWKFVDTNSKTIFNKMYEYSISLKEISNDRIYRGITTGLNEAFIINDIEKESILKSNPEAKEIIKKYVNPTSINKYTVDIDENKKWFINSHNGILMNKTDYLLNKKIFDGKTYLYYHGQKILVKNIEENRKKVRINRILIKKNYPSILKHFKSFANELKDREDQGEDWTNLRNCDYIYQMDLPKIIYIHTAKNHKFFIDEEGMMINNSCYMIVSDNKFLFFFLNSLLFDWFKRIKFVAYGDADEGGRVKLDYNKMITVPIKQITDKQSKWFEEKYKLIKKSLKNPQIVDRLEKEVETYLFKLYDFTFEEVLIIKPDYWLSEKEFKNC